MKNSLLIVILISLISCGAQKNESTSNTDEKQENTIKEVYTPKVDKNSLALKSTIEASMKYLASDELEGRKTGTKGIEKAAVYIESVFKNNNIKPYFKTYRDTFQVKDIYGYNIVGMLEGNDPKLKNEYVILGAHYDHIGNGEEVNGDVIANGANDDASGTVAVLEWAKYFAKTKSNKRSILFTLYSAEEMGLLGSGHLALKLKDANLNLYTMINFEMIGVPRSSDKTMAYMSGYEKSNMAKHLNAYAGKELIGFFPKAKDFQLFKRSDNYPFYREFKIPAHAISTFDFTNFEYYHHVDDEADKMDFDHMTSFINKLIPALTGMINSSAQEIKMNE